MAPDWPPLRLDEADAVLRLYPQAGAALRLMTVSPRPFSAASLVETPHGPVFVKRHHRAVRTPAGLAEEHRLLQYLADGSRWPAGEAQVQAPLQAADGKTVHSRGDWVYEVHPLAAGADLYREAHSWTPFLFTGHAHAAGQALAALHLAVAGFAAPPRATQQLVTSWTIFSGDDPLHAMEAYLASRPALRAYAEQRRWRQSMRELLLPWHASLRPWLGRLQPLWTHNDFHASNLMWSGSGPESRVTAIVDFGLADKTTAVHDLATAIERNGIEWLRMGSAGIVHLDQIDALLAGYESLRPLDPQERRALAALLPLVHAEFSLAETEYYLAVLHDPAKAALGYEGYFLGHAAWFREGEGAHLLQHLEHWARSGAPAKDRA